MNLAIVSTHPIQYYAPLFQLLAKEADVNLKVFYTWGESVLHDKFDPDFGKNIEWDIPLLNGYNYHFTKNTSKEPGSHHFKGIVTPNLIAEVQDFAPDAILIYGYAYQGHLKLMRYFRGKIPIWFRGDSTLLDADLGWKKYLKSLYLSWVYRYIDKALYVGTNNRHYFEKFGVSASKLHFVPHSIDNERFAEDRRQEASELRERLGISASEILVLFAGKLEEKKNPFLLLNFAKGLGRTDVHFLFVGNGELEQGLKADASTALSIANQIHFLDFQNQSYMPVLYQACDVFCLPSKGPGETWGLAVNEAMVAGKAVIVSDKVGCAVDLVENGANGFVFKSDNSEDFADKFRKISDKEQLQRMGERSAEMIKNWSLQKQLAQLKSLWR